jgi:hypothetical protein
MTSQLFSRATAFATLVFLARALGLETYGVYVILSALLAAGTLAWNPTVVQSVATRMGTGTSQRSWNLHLVKWGSLGTIAVGPIAWFVDGWQAALALAISAGAEALMLRSIPALLLRGEQRRLAYGIASSQATRLAAVVVFFSLGILTPALALLAHGLGFFVGLIAQGRERAPGAGSLGNVRSEMTVDALRWIENYASILGVAVFIGLEAAGGFDLMMKLALAAAEVMAAVGLIVLPNMVGRGAQFQPAFSRGLRLPSLAAIVAAALYAALTQPVLSLLTGAKIELYGVPILLSVVVVLGPWMGISKTALLSIGAAGWLVPSQLASSSATLLGGFLAPVGVVWPAIAVAAAHLAAGVIRWYGLRSHEALPPWRSLLSANAFRHDLSQMVRLLGRRTND